MRAAGCWVALAASLVAVQTHAQPVVPGAVQSYATPQSIGVEWDVTGDDDFIAPELTGLTKDQVDATIAKQTSAFKACAARDDGPSAAGKLVVAFHITDDGSLAKVEAQSSTLTVQAAEDCILQRFGRIQFVPPNDGYTDGTYEFRF